MKQLSLGMISVLRGMDMIRALSFNFWSMDWFR